MLFVAYCSWRHFCLACKLMQHLHFNCPQTRTPIQHDFDQARQSYHNVGAFCRRKMAAHGAGQQLWALTVCSPSATFPANGWWACVAGTWVLPWCAHCKLSCFFEAHLARVYHMPYALLNDMEPTKVQTEKLTCLIQLLQPRMAGKVIWFSVVFQSSVVWIVWSGQIQSNPAPILSSKNVNIYLKL